MVQLLASIRSFIVQLAHSLPVVSPALHLPDLSCCFFAVNYVHLLKTYMGSIKQYKQGVSLPQSQLRQNINLTIILLLDCIAQGS